MGIANQAVTPGRTTLLNAVNVLLENIGEQPINSLETEQVMDARVAERTLLEFHKRRKYPSLPSSFPRTNSGTHAQTKE